MTDEQLEAMFADAQQRWNAWEARKPAPQAKRALRLVGGLRSVNATPEGFAPSQGQRRQV